MTTRLLPLLLPALLAAQAPPFHKLSRISDQPILLPQGSGFESAGVFNPAVTRAGGRYVMLYRAQDGQGVSRLGYATSKDGVHFTRKAQPVLSPEADYERGGVEDPRIVRRHSADLQRRRRLTRIPHRLGTVRCRRSGARKSPQRSAGLRAGARMGEGGPGSECRVYGRAGAQRRIVALLLRRRGQVHRGGDGGRAVNHGSPVFCVRARAAR